MIGNLLKGTDGMLYQLGAVLAEDAENKDGVGLEPLALTEQWLLDFGYRKAGGAMFHSETYAPVLSLDGNIFRMDFHGEFVSQPLAFVHQLQNLFSALTGKQLARV